MKAEFDQFKDSYRQEVEASTSFSGKGHEFYTGIKVRALLRSIKRNLGDPSSLSVLDVGCGPGITDNLLLPHFRKLHGVDISRGMIEVAAEKNPSAHFLHYEGTKLPFDDGTFDVTFTICVLHHVKIERWLEFIREMKRVTRPGGLCFVFEHNPLNPLTLKAVRDCKYNCDAVLLRRSTVRTLFTNSKLNIVESRYILFAPFRGEWIRKGESLLRRIPLGAQYYLCGRA